MSTSNGNGTSGTMPFDERMCERYLFGELTEPEQESFETAYFSDDAFFNRFLAVKDELLDLYSRGELAEEKRKFVEAHFRATAPRRESLAESQDFIRSLTVIANRHASAAAKGAHIESKPETLIDSIKRLFSFPALAAVGILLVLSATGFWVIWTPTSQSDVAGPNDQSDRPQSSSDGRVPIENPQPAPESDKSNEVAVEPSPTDKPDDIEVARDPETTVPPPDIQPNAPKQPAVLPPTQPSPNPSPEQQQVAEVPKPEVPKSEVTGERIEMVTLSSTSRSVTSRNTASIGTATRSVSIRVLFGGEAYPSYSVRVATLGGDTVWRASSLTGAQNDGPKALAISVPAASLTRKDYIVTVEGRSKDGRLETIREYYLHVNRP